MDTCNPTDMVWRAIEEEKRKEFQRGLWMGIDALAQVAALLNDRKKGDRKILEQVLKLTGTLMGKWEACGNGPRDTTEKG